MSLSLAPALLAALVGADTSTTGATYQLVDEPAALYVTLKPRESSIFGFLAHRHVVEARGFRGQVSYDLSAPARCRIEVDVPVAGLVVDRPELRRSLDLGKDISDGDRATVDQHMRAEGQLDEARHDRIRFRSRTCERSGGGDADGIAGRYVVEGDLEIRGVAKRMRVPVEVSVDGEELRVRSEFSDIHESFGFSPYSAFAGTVANDRMIQFWVRLRARPSR